MILAHFFHLSLSGLNGRTKPLYHLIPYQATFVPQVKEDKPIWVFVLRRPQAAHPLHPARHRQVGRITRLRPFQGHAETLSSALTLTGLHRRYEPLTLNHSHPHPPNRQALTGPKKCHTSSRSQYDHEVQISP